MFVKESFKTTLIKDDFFDVIREHYNFSIVSGKKIDDLLIICFSGRGESGHVMSSVVKLSCVQVVCVASAVSGLRSGHPRYGVVNCQRRVVLVFPFCRVSVAFYGSRVVVCRCMGPLTLCSGS